MVDLIGDVRGKQNSEVTVHDPAAGLILTQGHYLIHGVYWFVLTFFVQFRDEDSFTCVEQDEETGQYTAIPDSVSEINRACEYTKWVHLILFFLLLISHNYVPSQITTNTNVTKYLLSFVTVPVYIFMILWLESAQNDDRIMFEEGPPNFKTKGTVCVSKDMGNVKEWAFIEIYTFYLNIGVMMAFLFQTLILSSDSDEPTASVASKIADAKQSNNDSKSAINQDETSVSNEQNENNQIIENALSEIDASSDLLRTFDEKRQFARIHILLVSLTCTILWS